MEGQLIKKGNEYIVSYQTQDGVKELPLYHKDYDFMGDLAIDGTIVDIHFEIVDEFSHPQYFEDVDYMCGVECAKFIYLC